MKMHNICEFVCHSKELPELYIAALNNAINIARGIISDREMADIENEISSEIMRERLHGIYRCHFKCSYSISCSLLANKEREANRLGQTLTRMVAAVKIKHPESLYKLLPFTKGYFPMATRYILLKKLSKA